MYGRGNYAPPFGQGLQRPMPPYQQQLAGHLSASHFQPGNSVPLQPVNQQGGPPPRGPPYLHAPPAPLNMPQQGPAVSTSNTGQPFLHPPLTAHNGAAVRLPFLAAQQNFVSGSQNPHPPPPPPSSIGPRAPPPPPFMQLPPPPPLTAAGFFPTAIFESVKPQSTETHMPGVAPQPPPLPPSSPPRAPPPPSSCSPSSPGMFPAPTNLAAGPPNQLGRGPISVQVLVSESSANITTHSKKSGGSPISDESLKHSVLVDLPPPPPKPPVEHIVRNIEVLCQFIAKNGPEFEEMVRKKESGNPEFNFLVGGDPGSDASSAHEYFLWMKKKCALENDLHKDQGQRDLSERYVDVEPSSGSISLPSMGKAHSPADSDVDMEDDITQSDKEHGIYNSVEDVEPESLSAGGISEMQKQENDNELQHPRDNSPTLKSSPSVKFQADAESKPEKYSGQPTTIHSPFRMIQNYTSDDSSDNDAVPYHENVNAVVESPLAKSGAVSSHDGMEHIHMNFKSGSTSETDLGQSFTTCLESGLTKQRDDLQEIQGDLQEASTRTSQGICKTDDIYGRTEGSNTNVVFQGKYASGSSGIDSVSTGKDVKKEDKKNTPTGVKVDEFGRLVKEGASESDSDDSHHLRRCGRRDRSLSRSRSRSRSPSNRRRRSPRRSPRRRKERRSRSRSWSPKRRRSRSRSPYRSGGDFRGEKLRRGKIQTRDCFDFLKGRCYRGASCRYAHHESDKNENPRRNNSKQHQLESMGCVPTKSVEHNDVKGGKMHFDLDKHDNRALGLQTCNERSKAEFIDDAVRPSVSHQDVEKLATDVKNCDGSRNGDEVSGASDEPISHLPICQEHPSSSMPPINEQVLHPQAQGSAGSHHRLEEEPQKMDNSSKIDSSTVQTSAISPSGLSVNEPSVNKMSNESTANASAPDFSYQVSHFPPPTLPQQAASAPLGPNMQADYNLLASSGSFPPQSVPIESGPLYQQSHNPVPPYPAWNTLPQARPPHMVGPSMPGAPLQFQQGNFPLRNDFPGHSQIGGFSHQTYHLPSSNIPAQPFAGSNLVRDDRYSQFPTPSLVPSTSFVPGVAPQPVPFQGDSTVRNTQSFPGDNLLAGESSKPSFQNHQLVQQRLPPYGTQLTASESMPSHLGGSFPVPGYSSNPNDRDNSSSCFDVGGSRISTHYNPYASTFDQPLSTRFSSIAFTQEREAVTGIKYDSSFGLGHAPIDEQTAGDHGSRQIISSSNVSKVGGQTVLKSGGDQYDPLFDSIDPFSESLKKHTQKQDHAADNSDIISKLSSRHNVLDVEENNKQKVVGAVAATASLENDEFGETADAEVGAVEDGSPSDPNEDADIAEGDFEIDQVKPEGRSKKNKDSRSMKLFKVAVANFVKEVLKPQWRQGNMSKEVFKTIVKKTVDKVSGAMKNHRLPKSQAKIDHYIDSSRRKLTQLVEGYVSKYKS